MKQPLPNLNKIIPIILVVLISLNTFGFNLVLECLLYSWKTEFKEYVVNSNSEKKITIFHLSELDQNKLRRFDDEINYDGHMYDVVKEGAKKNDVYIYCVKDKKEDELNDLVSEQHTNKKYPLKLSHLIKNMTKIYLSPPKDNKLFSDHISFSTFENKKYTSRYREVISPPPNFLF